MKRLTYLLTAILVALLILVPTALAQEEEEAQEETMPMQEETLIYEKEVPKTGGPRIQSVLLPAAALLVGSGVLTYAVLRRR